MTLRFLHPALAAAALAALLLSLAPHPAHAQDEEAPPDALLATVDGEEIRLSDVDGFIATLPAQLQQIPREQLFPLAVQEIINTILLVQQARADGLESDDGFKRRLRIATDELLRDAFLEKIGDSVLTEQAVAAYYQENIVSQGGEVEVRARHILVETREEAEEIYVELEEGADFATLARERSTGLSAPAGGDLGFYPRENLVAPFADVAWSMEVGEISEPVETQFGWHVIMVEDRRETAPPPLEAVADEIRQQLFRDAVNEVLEVRRTGAEIVYFNSDGTPAAAEGAPAAGEDEPADGEAAPAESED